MQETIDAPYKDTSSDELSWAWGLEPQEALSVKTLTSKNAEVEMRLLGASHQIIVTVNGKKYSEVVACLSGAGQELPQAAKVGANYKFTSKVHKLSDEEFKREVAAVKEETQSGENSLSAIFPGSPDALTAMLVDAEEEIITWRTWHAYPQHNELVETRSELTL